MRDKLGRSDEVTRVVDLYSPTRTVRISVRGGGRIKIWGIGEFSGDATITVPDGQILTVVADSVYEADNLAYLVQDLSSDLDVLWTTTGIDHAELQVKVTRDGSITAEFKKVYVKVTLTQYKSEVLGDPCNSQGVTVRVYAKAHFDIDVQAPYRLYGRPGVVSKLNEIICQLKVDFYPVMGPGIYPPGTSVDVPYKVSQKTFTSPTTTSFDLEVSIEHHIPGPIGPLYSEPVYHVGILANAQALYDSFAVAVDVHREDEKELITVNVCKTVKTYRVKVDVKSVGSPPLTVRGSIWCLDYSWKQEFAFDVEQPGVYEAGTYDLIAGFRYAVEAEAIDARGQRARASKTFTA